KAAASGMPPSALRLGRQCLAPGVLHGFFQFAQIDVLVDHFLEQLVFFFRDVVIGVFAQYGEVGVVQVVGGFHRLQAGDQFLGAGVFDPGLVQQAAERFGVCLAQE